MTTSTTTPIKNMTDSLTNNFKFDTSNKAYWVTIQITSILMIIFFGMIAIAYILFINTHILDKKGGILLKSIYFKAPMLSLILFSSMVMITIIANSTNIDVNYVYLIITSLVILNIIIFVKTFLENDTNNTLEKIQNSKIAHNVSNIMSFKVFDQPIMSYISLLLIGIFMIFAYKTTINFNSVMYGLVSACLILEYLINQRYYSLTGIFENIDDSQFSNRLIFFISYILILFSILSFAYSYSYSINV